jgi:hypothetical protein
MEPRVRVRDKGYFVDVRQISKTVWIASGDYMGESLVCRASSRRSALASWRDLASYKAPFYHAGAAWRPDASSEPPWPG